MNTDLFGRKIDYLRLAVTFGCNLSCRFCSPGNYDCTPDDFELSDNAILKITAAAAKIGIKKVRLTGGEPLLRPGITDIAWQIRNFRGIEEVTLTTNGSMLKNFAEKLHASGIQRLNVNLPSLDERRFKRLTGADLLRDVIDGIKTARKIGLGIKINVVALSDMDEKEVVLFSKFAADHALELRFIEYMPLTMGVSIMPRSLPMEILERWIEKNCISAKIIASMKHPFCGTCSRLRISSAGDIYPCLFGKPSHNLKENLKRSVDDIAKTFHESICCKPQGRCSANTDANFKPLIRATGG